MKDKYNLNGYQQWLHRDKLWLITIMKGTTGTGYEEQFNTGTFIITRKKIMV